MNIVQIACNSVGLIIGLGSDNKVYSWSYNKADWDLYGYDKKPKPPKLATIITGE